MNEMSTQTDRFPKRATLCGNSLYENRCLMNSQAENATVHNSNWVILQNGCHLYTYCMHNKITMIMDLCMLL